jgi:hypothetical protein
MLRPKSKSSNKLTVGKFTFLFGPEDCDIVQRNVSLLQRFSRRHICKGRPLKLLSHSSLHFLSSVTASVV